MKETTMYRYYALEINHTNIQSEVIDKSTIISTRRWTNGLGTAHSKMGGPTFSNERKSSSYTWQKLSAILNFVISTVLICYIEPYEVQHPQVQIDKNIKCDLNSVISTVYVTSNRMRRNTRQFRWIEIIVRS